MEANNLTQLVHTFFEKLLIEIEHIEVNQEENNIYHVKIQTPDSSLIIGYSWKNLEDIRLILRQLISKITGENTIVHLEVNDYLIKKDEKLFEFIASKVSIVKKTGNNIILPYFNSYERKKIHAYILSLKEETIFSKSSWEWKERRITLFKKTDHLKTLDLDAIDI